MARTVHAQTLFCVALAVSLMPDLQQVIVHGENLDIAVTPVEKKCKGNDSSVKSCQSNGGKSNSVSSLLQNNSMDHIEIDEIVNVNRNNTNTDLHWKPAEPCSDNIGGGSNDSNKCIFVEGKNVPIAFQTFEAFIWFMHWTEKDKLDADTLQKFSGIMIFLTITDYLHATLLGIIIPFLFLSTTAILLSHRRPPKKSQIENDIFDSDDNDREGFYRAYARPAPQRLRVSGDGYRYSVAGSDMYNMFPMMGHRDSSRAEDDNGDGMGASNDQDAERTTRL